ncbi:MAG: tetratricopeptide repeat protein [Pseudomonadota bacterium]
MLFVTLIAAALAAPGGAPDTARATAGVGSHGVSGSRTVIGPDNTFLADGSMALLAGDYAEGVRLTEIGLRMARSDSERSAAYSNLCAGHIKLQHFDLALEQCDMALELKPNQWRAHSNRANVLLNLGRLEEAEAAVEAGLKIRPNSQTLLRVLDAARLERYRPTVTISDDP